MTNAVTAAIRDAESAPFFDAAAQDRLVIRRCRSCGHHLGIGVDAPSLAVGDRFEVAFTRPGDGEAIPVFHPAG